LRGAIERATAREVLACLAFSRRQTVERGTHVGSQNLYLRLRFAPKANRSRADGANVVIASGLAVNAEIKMDTRRILEFLFSPLVETASEAMHKGCFSAAVPHRES
jgi:hypothetical protein